MHRIRVCLAVVVCVCASVAAAQVNVGDKPKFAFEAHGSGEQITSDALKNKIVIVDFWATWCGPCMAEAGHMVEINSKYADKGLQFVGISLDRDAGALTRVVKDKNFTWPQAFGRPAQQMAAQWGVRGIPSTFILSPDGVVLWKGHPARIDKPLEDAFKTHPPRLGEGDKGSAATPDKAKEMLSTAAGYAQSGKTDLAKKKYQEVIDQFPGTGHAEAAKTELAKLQ